MCVYKKRSPPPVCWNQPQRYFCPSLPEHYSVVTPAANLVWTDKLKVLPQLKTVALLWICSIYVMLKSFVLSVFPEKIVHNLDISVLQALRVYLGHSPPHSKRDATRARLWILLVLPDRLLGQSFVLLFPQRSSSHCCLPLTILALMEIGNCWNMISNFVVCTCFLLRADIVSDLCRFLIVALLTTGKRS